MSASGMYESLGHQQITVTTAQSLTIPTTGTVAFALITPETQAVRWRDDGTAPTTSVGMPLAVGATLKYDAKSISAFQAIAQVAGGIINVAYYGNKP